MKAKGTTPRKALQRQAKPHSLSAPANYAAWKAQAMAALERPSAMLEREWRRVFILGMTPEQAARYAATHNKPVTVAPRRKR